MKALTMACCVLVGAILTLIAEHAMAGAERTVRLTDDLKVFGANHELLANFGRGTILSARTEGRVHWVSCRISFSEKTPPFEDADMPQGGERFVEVGSH